MLFDMEDYIINGVIGQNQVPMTAEMWRDIASTSSATRDAFFKAITEWYDAASVYTESTCTVSPQSVYAEYLDKKDKFIITQNAMWDTLSDKNLTLPRAEYDNCISELKSIMKTIKKLLTVVEGSKFKKV